MKWLSDLWVQLPRPIQWAIGAVLTGAVVLWAIGQFWPDAKAALGDSFELTPWERTQIKEDREHAGEAPVQVVERQSSSAYFYASGCILGKHVYAGRTVRTWIPHPSKYPPPPDHNEIYGGVSSSAGLTAGGCAPESACWQPLLDHPGVTDSQIVSEHRVDNCWAHRLMRISDGCQWTIPYSYCTGEWAWGHAEWYCCRRHR